MKYILILFVIAASNNVFAEPDMLKKTVFDEQLAPMIFMDGMLNNLATANSDAAICEQVGVITERARVVDNQTLQINNYFPDLQPEAQRNALVTFARKVEALKESCKNSPVDQQALKSKASALIPDSKKLLAQLRKTYPDYEKNDALAACHAKLQKIQAVLSTSSAPEGASAPATR